MNRKTRILIFTIILWLSSIYVYASCFEYWSFAIDNLNGTCSCMHWYHFENKYWSTMCVSDPTCTDLYWFWAQDNFNGTCSCRYWYVRGVDSLGYKACVDLDQECKSNYGLWSEWDNLSNKCVCSYWYVFWTDSLGNSSCVKKTNSVYFLLTEFDSLNDKALIYNWDTKINYLITYWIWCLSMWKYKGKLIVVNLWNNRTLDTWDTIVLPDDKETCSITSKEVVNDLYISTISLLEN